MDQHSASPTSPPITFIVLPSCLLTIWTWTHTNHGQSESKKTTKRQETKWFHCLPVQDVVQILLLFVYGEIKGKEARTAEGDPFSVSLTPTPSPAAGRFVSPASETLTVTGFVLLPPPLRWKHPSYFSRKGTDSPDMRCVAELKFLSTTPNPRPFLLNHPFIASGSGLQNLIHSEPIPQI